jgi:sortase A
MAWTTRRPRSEDASRASPVRLVDEHEDRVVVLNVDSSPAAKAGAKAIGPGARRRGGRPRRSRPARLSRLLALVLMFAGSLVLLDALVTFVWQEPISAIYAKLRQSDLGGTLRNEELAAPAPAVKRRLASLSGERARIALLARTLERHAGAGNPVGRISIPRIGANFVVVYGTTTSALESGPGVYPATRFPGLGGTTAIAGHRTTFLAPFRHIDALSRGARIKLYMPYAHFTYTVTGKRVVVPTDVRAATAELGYSRLVLSACTPLFSAAKRLLVYARLTRTVPVGAAARLPGGARPRPIESEAPHRVRPRLPAVLIPLDPQVLPPLSS